ncbi:MAG: HAMP domain-containing sensor histidine kinase [Pseudomonadota bacterium]
MSDFVSNLRATLSPIYLTNFGLSILLGGGFLFLLPNLPQMLIFFYLGIGVSFVVGGQVCRWRPEWNPIITLLGSVMGLLWALFVWEVTKPSGFIGAESTWMGLVLVFAAFFGGMRQSLALGAVYLFATQFLPNHYGPSINVSLSDVHFFYGMSFATCAMALIHFLLKFLQLSVGSELISEIKRQESLSNTGCLIRDLYGGIAHEINNPLQIINGSASRISRLTFESEKERRESLLLQHKLISASQIIGLFVKSLHSKMETGKGNELTHFLLSESVEKILTELGLINYTLVEGDGQLEVYTHRESLEQIIRSLLQNAKEAALAEQMPHIKINYRNAFGHIELFISDFGQGIEDEHAGAVFDQFFTTKNFTLHLGLGLSNSRAAAEQLKGTLELISAKNPTVFKVFLPQERWDI